VQWIRLDSPQTRNALSAALIVELLAHLEEAMADEAVRCIALTGSGSAFCAGADLRSRGDAIAPRGDERSPFVRVLDTLWGGPKPVIAAVNGHAFGGGVGLACACDVAIGVEGALLGFSEVRLGLVPATISVVVVRTLGLHHTRRLFLTGERFDAARAVEYGLLHRVVPAAQLVEAVTAEADAICRGGPVAVSEAKRLVRTVAALPMDEGFAFAEQMIAERFASAEADEGRAAFAEKRAPAWVRGR
jgi:methylglutaconyl-CoA hydratase